MKTIIKTLMIIFILTGSNSCKEVEDTDFIIEFLKIAKQGSIDSLMKLVSFEMETKEELYSQAQQLILDLKDFNIPDKSKIRQIIRNSEYPGYEFKFESIDVTYMIGLRKGGGKIAVVQLARI